MKRMTTSHALLEQRKTVLERSIPLLRKSIQSLRTQLGRTSGQQATHIRCRLKRLKSDLMGQMEELTSICTTLGILPDPNPAT